MSAETIAKRWHDINVVLRLSMMTGLQMPLEAALNLICDLAAEITPYEKCMVCFPDQECSRMQLYAMRGFLRDLAVPEHACRDNALNLWSARFERPLLVARGLQPQADAVLDFAGAQSALAVPLFMGHRALGSLQLFSPAPGAFTCDDARLLWILSLVAENLLTRDYSSESVVHFAFTDYLTGLRTRGYFEQQLDLEFKRAERRSHNFALLMIDIDQFKQLNDCSGHHVGDRVLREVGAILVKDMREIDTVARYGGDEFVIILPETGEKSALQVAQRLRRAVEQAGFEIGTAKTLEHLTLSIGVAVYSRDGRSKRELIEHADAALYSAKNEGRNRVVSYSQVHPPGNQQAS